MNGQAKGANGKAEHDGKLCPWISGANAKDEHPRPHCFSSEIQGGNFTAIINTTYYIVPPSLSYHALKKAK